MGSIMVYIRKLGNVTGIIESVHLKKLCYIYLVRTSFFFGHTALCGILDPWLWTEPGPLALKVLSPNHCATREFP